MAKMDFQPGYREFAGLEDLAASLRAGRLDPKLLYSTKQLTGLWRDVFQAHSPIHRNPEFARIYEDAFRFVAGRTTVDKLWLIGLGAGTGLKESKLAAHLKRAGREVVFSAVDVSPLLVAEATEAVTVRAGADIGDGLVGDLADTGFLRDWLDRCEVRAPWLFTFFGIVPNLPPATVARLFRAVLRPGDTLLCSAHLAPVDESTDVDAAMRRVLPQYDNAETLAWLKAAMNEWRLSPRLSSPVMTIGEVDGLSAFRGLAAWDSNEYFLVGGDDYWPDVGRPLELFCSRRYTPAMFEAFLQREGFGFEQLGMTACREEAIWAVRNDLDSKT